jgi:hypothetical protein
MNEGRPPCLPEARPPRRRTVPWRRPRSSTPRYPATAPGPPQPRRTRSSRPPRRSPADAPAGSCPLGVALHARRISHAELRCDIVQHHQRHIQRIGQERPHMTNRDQLQRPPEPVVITTPLRHKIPGPRRRGRRTAPAPPDPEAQPRIGHTSRVSHPSGIWPARAINVRHIHPLAPDFRPLVLMGAPAAVRPVPG